MLALYTIHYTQYTTHNTLHTIHYTQYTTHNTLHTIHYTQYTTHDTLHTLCIMHVHYSYLLNMSPILCYVYVHMLSTLSVHLFTHNDIELKFTETAVCY